MMPNGRIGGGRFKPNPFYVVVARIEGCMHAVKVWRSLSNP